MCIEANTMALAFEKRKGFIVSSPGKETKGRAPNILLDLGLLLGSVKLLWIRGRRTGTWKHCGASFPWRALELGHLYCKVRWRGLQHPSFMTMGPLHLKGFHRSDSGIVLLLWFCGLEKHWFWALFEVKIFSSTHTLAVWLVVFFSVVSAKPLSILLETG